ncbi:aspartate kinase [Chitinophaga terrae (ex Kim and Jung 2007)]|jgi:aspartate kinase|uniref:Aspartokinase n=1 Tax=Chitinophaga terrae (ex Kim and Jung 2007) TaxID=408074 RepID=A0A1H3Z6F2_9BACT|nr:aspartate kinase [Chitinophaga terrae (ex Kim and Jung 2007)]MDQ0107325.1 aspartate kinase [Chitinophaga terrae (ex Kim and Jung 2007)]GEP88595.1 aspartokinase [Chitinophaga terrae (ex Kim and Jung 2007)]SEA19255.1 aspartate kinase [Chitinophaga terrae (ex Kim and Jung 2007)]
MKVFKFGGASLESIERIRQVGQIVQSFPDEKLLIVISAMAKTTNELEKVAENFYLRKKEIAAQLLFNIEQGHLRVAEGLLGTTEHPVFQQLQQFFTEAEWTLGEKPMRTYDYYYDQLVSLGELLSTAIVSAYFNTIGLNNEWLDVRDVFRTDDNFRDANIDWVYTQKQVTEKVVPLFNKTNIVITQGFIGSTDQNESVTLGREGSDYSAAVFANMLDAESQTIWKDVEGLKNADPKLFPNTVNIPEISYAEVIEMAYYGAQVIHPKTIKPLQNKQIPLLVKCFLDKNLPGTVIREEADTRKLPPIIVLKKNQVLLTITSKDYSFITEDKISDIYEIFHGLKIKINLMQNGAINFSCCIDNNPEKIELLIKTLHQQFKISYNEGLELLTVRYYQPAMLEELSNGHQVMLEQRSGSTIQRLWKK